MNAAPKGKRIEIACRVRCNPNYVHRWTVICEINEPIFLDFAWREIGLDGL